MASIVRRVGAQLLLMLERTLDPGGVAGQVQVYSKSVVGVSQLFAQNGAGVVSQLTGSVTSELVPEMWAQMGASPSQLNVALETNVSQLFNAWRAIRGGSIIGITARFSTAQGSGTLTLTPTLNGVATGFNLATAAGATGGQITQAAGLTPFVASDRLGMQISTDAGFLPATGLDLECQIEIAV